MSKSLNRNVKVLSVMLLLAFQAQALKLGPTAEAQVEVPQLEEPQMDHFTDPLLQREDQTLNELLTDAYLRFLTLGEVSFSVSGAAVVMQPLCSTDQELKGFIRNFDKTGTTYECGFCARTDYESERIQIDLDTGECRQVAR